MKNLFKPFNLAFYFLMLLVFFTAGLFYAGWIEAGKNQGLAGGAIVLGYGISFGAVAFLASFFIARQLPSKRVVQANWILLILLVATWAYKRHEFSNAQKPSEEKTPPPNTRTTAPKQSSRTDALSIFSSFSIITSIKANPVSTPSVDPGIGFFAPAIHENYTVYFYGAVNPEKGLTDHLPQDSIVFALNEHGNFTTTYAPPWLLPEHMKLDYGLLQFRTLGIGRDFVKVVVNTKTGQIGYLDKFSGNFLSWPEFILSMNSVESLERQTPLQARVKPMENAGEVRAEFDFVEPLLLEGEWLYGKLLDQARNEKGKGWIRWRKDGQLLITYSFLS